MLLLKEKQDLDLLSTKKTATSVALTDFRPEDNKQFETLIQNFRTLFNDNEKLRKTWGGGILGQKSNHKIEVRQAALEAQTLKKHNM